MSSRLRHHPLSGTSTILLGILERALKNINNNLLIKALQHYSHTSLQNSRAMLYKYSELSKMRGVMSVKCKLILFTGLVKSPSPGSEDILEDPTPLALSVY